MFADWIQCNGLKKLSVTLGNGFILNQSSLTPLILQYKQIGNAVPVNLAYAIGRALVRLLNDLNSGDIERSRQVK